MRFRTYSHRFADAIIEHDEQLNRRYNEFVGALASITDEELIADFEQRRDAHLRRTKYQCNIKGKNAADSGMAV